MKKILFLLLLCSLPVTALGNASARRVGTAIIKLIHYSQYLGRNGRFFEAEGIASHAMPLHENSKDEKTITLYSRKTAKISITQTPLAQALVSIKFFKPDRDITTETTITYLEPVELEGGRVRAILPSVVQHSYEEIEVHLTNQINPAEEKSDTNESKK